MASNRSARVRRSEVARDADERSERSSPQSRKDNGAAPRQPADNYVQRLPDAATKLYVSFLGSLEARGRSEPEMTKLTPGVSSSSNHRSTGEWPGGIVNW